MHVFKFFTFQLWTIYYHIFGICKIRAIIQKLSFKSIVHLSIKIYFNVLPLYMLKPNSSFLIFSTTLRLSSHKLTRLHIHVLCMFTTPLMKLYFTLFNTKLTFYYWHDKQNKRKKRENKCLNKKRNIYWLGIMNNRQQILWILKKNLLF